MEHLVTVPSEPIRSLSGSLEVHMVPVWRDNIAWILVCTRTKEAAVVDSPAAQPVLDYAASRDFEITTILNTHHHPDHVGINQDLGPEIKDYEVVASRKLKDEVPGVTLLVDDRECVALGHARGTVYLTEGHVDGHVSYLFEDLLFCGDTMFAGGCGYLFDGPADKMFSSLEFLSELDSSTRIFCAHEYTRDNLRFAWSLEPDNERLAERIRQTWDITSQGRSSLPSTIGLERQTNPFLRWHSDDILASIRARAGDVDLSSPSRVFAATRALKDEKDYKSITDEQLPIES